MSIKQLTISTGLLNSGYTEIESDNYNPRKFYKDFDYEQEDRLNKREYVLVFESGEIKKRNQYSTKCLGIS